MKKSQNIMNMIGELIKNSEAVAWRWPGAKIFLKISQNFTLIVNTRELKR